ncbi:CDP-glycerol glycerophosphotransferase family protein [Alkalicoccobacillus gibsonii]|uniref:CDP-glycerol glycerophosphotransferase family protein n=1 Tax=Alkalicoccobacillus gibsonii TaxID=79881 RepID=UPI003511C3C2
MKTVQLNDDQTVLEDDRSSNVRNYEVIREVTSLTWNGSLMMIKGYAYFKNVALIKDDNLYKSLIFKNNNEQEEILFEFPLVDQPTYHREEYKWAGFKGSINLSAVTKGGAPLPNGSYNVFLSLSYGSSSDDAIVQEVTLGNVQKFLKNDFHSTKLEFYTAKRHLQYNLMATQNMKLKTLQLVSTKLKDLNPADLEPHTNKFTKKAKKRNDIFFKLLYKMFSILPIKKDRVTFASDSRIEMDGNFGFVYENMLEQGLKLDYKFMLKSAITDKKSFKETFQLAYWFATSKKIILDDFYPLIYPLKIREEADLIQVWHAVGAFKTFGYSRVGRPGGPSIKSLNHRNYTKAVVSSKNIVRHYAEGFGIEEEAVVPIGVPRTDIFFDEKYKDNKRNELYDQYPFLQGKKVILFAPTFRGNGQSSAHYPYDMLNLEKLYNELKDEYIFIFKVHPFIKNKISIPYHYEDFFYDFSEHREINDLLFVTDILITDYSSVCFEYALLRKPMIFFSYDVEEYIQKRDFYFEYQSFIPGVLAKTTEDILYSITNNHFESEKIEPFVKYFFDDLDGKSSERFVNQLIKEDE